LTLESTIVDPRQVYTPAEIAIFAKCSQAHVLACTASGDLPAYRLGKRLVRIVGNAALDWMDRRGHVGATPAVKRVAQAEPPLAPQMKAIICKHSIPYAPIDLGHIYFVQCSRFVKVGYSGNPARRLLGLQIGNPYELKLLGTVRGSQSGEEALHELLRKYHHKFEWFRLVPRLSTAIRELCNVPDA
jgi:hypothetical protein